MFCIHNVKLAVSHALKEPKQRDQIISCVKIIIMLDKVVQLLVTQVDENG